MNERASETHLAEAGSPQRSCKECGVLFTPRRSWAEFCKNKCRNDFHSRAARLEAIRAVALRMFEALQGLAKVEGPVGQIAATAIKDLKAP